MDISKAIEILADTFDEPWVKYNPDVQSSLKLGIEALKYIKDQRADWLVAVFQELPGETEE